MNIARLSSIVFLLLPVGLGFAAAQREEAVLLGDSRKVTVAVPTGFTFASKADEAGLANVEMGAAGGKVSLHLVFVPDPDGRAMQTRARKERLVEFFQSYVEGSVEKAMQFEELAPRRGAGTYCVFTDANLVGRTELPPNEFHHLTAGIKAWPGVMVVFRLFSQDTTSAEYRSALRLLRESVEER